MTAGAPPILQVLVSTQPGGGPQHVLALTSGLRRRGWRFVVAAPRDGVLFERFGPIATAVVEARTDRLNPATVLKLVRVIRRHHEAPAAAAQSGRQREHVLRAAARLCGDENLKDGRRAGRHARAWSRRQACRAAAGTTSASRGRSANTTHHGG